MKRKILSIILTLALAFSLLQVSALASYTDATNHWAQAAIDKWSGLGIVQGNDGKFRPDDPITRGELAVIIDRIMKYQTVAPNTFTDLGQAYYTDAVLKANAAGVILGSDGAVRPTAKITREEAIVMLARALGVTASEVSANFKDLDSISSWALGYVNAMAARGFVHGTDGKFNPKAFIDRASIVTLFDNVIVQIYSVAQEYTGNVAGTVVVNAAGVVLKNMTITGDLIIAEGVGNGDVTLDNVVVTGTTFVRGGGANSIHINGNSNLATLVIEKTDNGKIRVVTSDGSTVDVVVVDDGNDDIILTGTYSDVTINAEGVNVIFDTNSSIGTLTVNVQANITNNGNIDKARINADDIVLTGNDPGKIEYGTGVLGAEDTDDAAPTGGGGGGFVPLALAVTDVGTVNASTITFTTTVAGATIRWNGTALTTTTNSGTNTVTVPLMQSGTVNTLSVEKAGYATFNGTATWNDPYNSTGSLGTWRTDRTEPQSWVEEDGWITLATKTEPNDNWYAWQGRKTETGVGLTSDWKVETQLKLTDDMVTRDGIRASFWVQVEGFENYGVKQDGVIDWAILQFKKDSASDTAGWQAWNSTGKGGWQNVSADIPATAGTYTLTMIYQAGTLYQYINGILANQYDINTADGISAPTHVYFNSYSFGASYAASWKVPTVDYLYQYTADAKCISDVDDLVNAINNQADGQTWIIKSGTYDLPRNKTITAGSQTGWYFPITASNLTIIGQGNPILTSSVASSNGSWNTQSFISVWADNVKISGVTIQPKDYAGKAIEILGKNFKLYDSVIKPRNDATYDWSGMVMFNPGNGAGDKDIGSAEIVNTTIYKSGISCSTYYVANGTLKIQNVTVDITGMINHIPQWDDWFRGVSIPGSSHITSIGSTVIIDNNVPYIQDEVLDYVRAGTTVRFAAGTYYVPAALTYPTGITVDDDAATIVVLGASEKVIYNIDDLTAALAAQDDGQTWYIMSGTYALNSQIRIMKAITIIGAGDSTIITKGSAAWTNTTGSKGYAPLITISSGAGAVKLENIKVTGAANIAVTPSGTDYGSGINVVSSSNVVLNNVTTANNAAAGLIVNCSTVTATNLNTTGNSWGSVNVDIGSDKLDSVFTLTSGTLSEINQIWSDGDNVTVGGPQVTVNADGYTKYHVSGTVNGYKWTNRPLTNVVTITTAGVTTIYPTLQAAVTAAASGDTIDIFGDCSIVGVTCRDKKLTFVGNSSLPKVAFPAAGYQTYYGCDFTFDYLTLQCDPVNNYMGIQPDKMTATNCVINGKFWGYAKDLVFTACTFSQTTNDYNIWTYGSNATFNSCKFNSLGRSVLIYNEGATQVTPAKIVFDTCSFFNAGAVYAEKAAIEISTYAYADKGGSFDVEITHCSATGFDTITKAEGVVLSAGLANLKQIGVGTLTVKIDGTQVYPK